MCYDISILLPACSGAQRAVYEAVLEVHQACLDLCQPGATLRQLHHVSVRLLADALAQVRCFRTETGLEDCVLVLRGLAPTSAAPLPPHLTVLHPP